MGLFWMTTHTLKYFLLWQILESVSGQPSQWIETWCEISPKYTTVEVREGEPGQIVSCAIPDLPGSSVEIVNQLGNVVHMRREISKHVSFKQAVPSIDNVTRYQLNITWTQDRSVHEQLRVIQCVANFQGRTNPCRTSMVTIDFEESSKRDMPTETNESFEKLQNELTTSSPQNSSSSRTFALTVLLPLLMVAILFLY